MGCVEGCFVLWLLVDWVVGVLVEVWVLFFVELVVFYWVGYVLELVFWELKWCGDGCCG